MSIIKVKNLGKKFVIGHDRYAGGAYGYRSLRDTIGSTMLGLFQRFRHPLSPNSERTELEDFWALRNVNFEVRRGDRLGIIGRNGAGKSTLLKILSRISEPTFGRIEIEGRVTSLLEVGTGFHPELSGRENIFLNGAVLGMTRTEIHSRFDEIVAFAEIDRFLDTPVKRYSSGMYVRLAFAVAAHLEPEILIVDEVLAVGDASFQRKCLGKMQDVSKEGRTILFVSHNMDAIGALCNRGLLLEDGSITVDASVREAITKYFKDRAATNFFTRSSPPDANCYLTAASLIKSGTPTTSLQNGDKLRLDLEIVSTIPRRISFEIILRDQNYRTDLFGPIGLARNQHHELGVKLTRASLEYDLPFLASGDYYIDILLVDAGKEIIDNNGVLSSCKIKSTYEKKPIGHFGSREVRCNPPRGEEQYRGRNISMNLDYIIVGSGLTGATIARVLCDAGKQVLVIERRDEIGGNVVDFYHESGIRMNRYGPHYFRTKSKSIWDFVRRFADFFEFEAVIFSEVDEKLFHWPVVRSELTSIVGIDWVTGRIENPRNLEEASLNMMPQRCFDLFVKEYSEKQWGMACANLSAELAGRFEVRDGDDFRLKRHPYQGIPCLGYSHLMTEMLRGIPVILNCDYLKCRGFFSPKKKTIFTGSIDSYFDYEMGKLAYRAQRRVHQYFPDLDYFQSTGQINNPLLKGGEHIRTLEWKHMLKPEISTRIRGTVITREFPSDPESVEEYEYPFPDGINRRLYERYKEMAVSTPGVVFCGRLGGV